MKRLLQMLAVLLAVHVGFAQAGMAHASVHEPVVVQSEAAEANPSCHHQATPDSPPATHDSRHKSNCCDAGSCHCAAVCAMPLVSTVMTPSDAPGTPTFTLPSAPAVLRAPAFRPPIL
ncbi:MAG TPA: CopL family metal-binding regulatory protein [Steroidobacteraceae bacterium]|nr:CopL family metal-binding regulatory protein [Steroidobacteraceae bacterium]